jgi:two-component system sensor histidine kinase BaeS
MIGGVLGMESWWSAIADQPVATTLAALLLAALSAASGLVLRAVTRRTRSLRHLVLAITLTSLAIGAAAALLLARLMVFDAREARIVLGVLATTAVFATLLALVASAPLGRDAQRVEAAVRQLESGDRTGRTGVVRADELGHVARALDELTVRLDALERERVTFEEERRMMLSSVGHDLRTPLAALRAALEALVDGVAPDPDRYLRSMVRDVEVLGSLVDDLFLLARIESGRLELHREPIDLAELADGAIEALAPAAAASEVTLHLRSPGRVAVDASASALGRVMRNLIDNAIRHAPANSIVVVEVDAPGTVRVIDEGPGFPPDFAAFERFSRVDPSRNRSSGGSGLGLAIARGLVEAHGGHIWIEHEGGGRVAFELPAA